MSRIPTVIRIIVRPMLSVMRRSLSCAESKVMKKFVIGSDNRGLEPVLLVGQTSYVIQVLCKI